MRLAAQVQGPSWLHEVGGSWHLQGAVVATHWLQEFGGWHLQRRDHSNMLAAVLLEQLLRRRWHRSSSAVIWPLSEAAGGLAGGLQAAGGLGKALPSDAKHCVGCCPPAAGLHHTGMHRRLLLVRGRPWLTNCTALERRHSCCWQLLCGAAGAAEMLLPSRCCSMQPASLHAAACSAAHPHRLTATQTCRHAWFGEGPSGRWLGEAFLNTHIVVAMHDAAGMYT
jgi:hypothetical protein